MVFGFWKKAPLELEPGDDVEVTFSPSVGSSQVEIMKVHHQARDGIILLVPEKYRGENPFAHEMPVQVYVRKDLMLGNFFTRVTDTENLKEQDLVHIGMPDRVRWVEMDSSNLPFRDYRRVEAKVPVEIGFEQQRIKGVTQDLSGGGTQVITSLYVPEDEEIDLRIALPGSSVFTRAKVLRCRKIKSKSQTNDEKQSYRMALEFTRLDEESRNRVIYFTINGKEPATVD